MLTSPAIILSARDHGDAHRMVTFYTRDHGKIDARVTGVRKPTSKLAGHLTELGVIDCAFFVGPRMTQLIHATRTSDFPYLRTDLARYGIAHAACEVVDVLTKPGIDDARIFLFLERFFVRLNEPKTDHADLFRRFLVALFAHMGIGKKGDAELLTGEQLLQRALDRPLASIAFVRALSV